MFEKLLGKSHGIPNIFARARDKVLAEKSFPVTDTMINLILEKNLDRLSETVGAVFKSVEIKSMPDGITIWGRVIKSDVAADFSIKVVPLEPIWLENNHQVWVTVTENSLVIDKGDVRGLLASLWNSILSSITGEDLLNTNLRCLADENGVISFGLDGLDKRMDGAMGVLDLKRISPTEGKIIVTGSLNMKNAFSASPVEP